MKVVGVRKRDGGLGRGGRREGRRGEQNKTGDFIASSESLTYQKTPESLGKAFEKR